MVRRGIESIRLPIFSANCWTNDHTRGGMSSGRSRSGGMEIGKTFSR